MSSNFKSLAPSHPEAVRTGNAYRVAIVGAGSLKGKEVADVLSDRNFPSLDVKLLDDDEALGKLENMKDEVTFIQSVRSEQFDHIDFTFFASEAESARENWKKARKAGSDIIDLSFGLEDVPGATVRSPWVERQLGHLAAPELQPAPVVIAHPAAVVLALILLRVQNAAEPKHVSATIFEPASEHGQKGMDELHEQTVNLLSFQPLPTAVFGVQVAFNMLARYGAQSVPPLSAVHERILRHYLQLAGKHAFVPSLLVLQAPIFHGHAFAIHVQTGTLVDIAKIAAALSGDHITITPPAEDAPSNVNVAGQGNILVNILPDENDQKSFWMWAAADNLRIAASTAVECAESMAAARPKGKIQ
ncbi:MAG: Asd/ArgC dimerization domain-containing protein [Terriglobales bacterium]